MRNLLVAALLFVGASCAKRPPLLPTDEVVHACMTEAACGLTLGFDLCVAAFAFGGRDPQESAIHEHVTAAEATCLAAAGTDCDRARACLNDGAPAPVCDPNTFAGGCDGDVMRYCNDENVAMPKFTAAIDCASVGLHCLSDSHGHGACGYGACPDGNVCDGDVLLVCENQLLYERQDCSQSESICATDAYGNFNCVAAGPGCSPTAAHCEGDMIVGCDTAGHERRIDCAAQGLRCVTYEGAIQCANGSECAVDTATQTCDGNRLRYCFDGIWLTADCLAAGFSGCAPSGCTL